MSIAEKLSLVPADQGLSGPVPDQLRRLWSQHLQRRSMRLLLLHDQRLFRGRFRAFYTGSDLPRLPIFVQYDRFLTLRTLSDELLDDIMPRVRRQLSLQTDQTRLVEAAPTRGDIDWPRTVQRGWRETPGLPALMFETRLRQRTTVTPENLFTVAVLLAYQELLRRFLSDALADETLAANERQLLAAADEQAGRELAAAYARALLPLARQSDPATLATRVEARLRPGPDPYRDLLAWWRRFTTLQVGRGTERRGLTLAPQRSDDQTDAWLYELWIMLELLHLLDEDAALSPEPVAVANDRLSATFSWCGHALRLTYNRQAEGAGGSSTAWQHSPGVRPDYTIERINALNVAYQQQSYWHEPPAVMDAKFYLSGSDPERTHEPIKKLLGDMTLLGVTHCTLFFPALPEPAQPESHASRIIARDPDLYHSGVPLPPQVRLYHLDPLMPVAALQTRLRAVLDEIGQTLGSRPTTITCQGVCLDADSINANGRLTLTEAPLLCPKPHIGPGVYDMVSRSTDCLKNARVCHVIGQPIMPPFVLRVTSQSALQQQASSLRDEGGHLVKQLEADGGEASHAQAEQLRAHIFTGVGQSIEQYVRLRGNTRTIEEYLEQWIFGPFWSEKRAWALAPETREMLKSGEYVWQEYAQTDGLSDWAAPAIQFCRALELELKRRFFQHYPRDFKVGKAGWTIGTPVHAFRHRKTNPNARTNLTLLFSLVEPVYHWGLARQLYRLIAVHATRNRLAHSEPLARDAALRLRATIIGSRKQPGILCWLAEHVQPAHG